MTRVTMGDVWDDTKAFVAREAALLLPLAFATLGLANLLLALSPDVQPSAATVPGPWTLALVPIAILLLAGTLAVTMLALRPGDSVADALSGAVRRLPGMVVASLIVGVALIVVLVPFGLLASVLAATLGGGMAFAKTLLTVVVPPLMLWVSVRLLPVVPLIAVEPPTLRTVPLLRRAFAMTRGRAGPIAGATIIYVFGSLLVSLALSFALGSVFLLIGRALGLPALGVTLTALAGTIANTILQTVWIVFQAMLYRRLAAAAG